MAKTRMNEEERKRKINEKAKEYYQKHKNDPEFKAKIAERNKRSREKQEKKRNRIAKEKPKAELVPEDLPADSIEEHPKHTVVIAQGWEPESGKTVIVERWTREGFPVFRTKVIICRHYKTKAKALLAARAEVGRLRQYNDLIDLNESERR